MNESKLDDEANKLLNVLYEGPLAVNKLANKRNPAGRFKLLAKALCLLSSVPLHNENESEVAQLDQYWEHFKKAVASKMTSKTIMAQKDYSQGTIIQLDAITSNWEFKHLYAESINERVAS